MAVTRHMKGQLGHNTVRGRHQSWNVLKEAVVKLVLFHACANVWLPVNTFYFCDAGLVQNCCWSLQVKKAESCPGLFHFPAWWVLLRSPRCCRYWECSESKPGIDWYSTTSCCSGWSPQLKWEKWQSVESSLRSLTQISVGCLWWPHLMHLWQWCAKFRWP